MVDSFSERDGEMNGVNSLLSSPSARSLLISPGLLLNAYSDSSPWTFIIILLLSEVIILLSDHDEWNSRRSAWLNRESNGGYKSINYLLDHHSFLMIINTSYITKKTE